MRSAGREKLPEIKRQKNIDSCRIIGELFPAEDIFILKYVLFDSLNQVMLYNLYAERDYRIRKWLARAMSALLLIWMMF